MAQVDEPFSFVEWIEKDGRPTQYFYQLMLSLWKKTGSSDTLLSSDTKAIQDIADPLVAGLEADLADTTDTEKGDDLVGGKRTDTDTVAFTLHDYHENRVINVKTDFGAVGDGTTDDTVAIQAAIDTGLTIWVPVGSYKLTSAINIISGLTLFGSGPDTLFITTTTTAGAFAIATNSAVYLSDFQLESSILTTTASAISLGGINASNQNTGSQFDKITFSTNANLYNRQINVTAATGLIIKNCRFVTPVDAAIAIENTSNADSGDNQIGPGNMFASGTTSGIQAIYHLDSGGLRIISNKFLGYEYAYYLNLQNTTGVLVINGNSIEGQGTASLYFSQGVTGKSFQGISISGNQFSGSINVVKVDSGDSVWLQNLVIGVNTSYNPSTTGTTAYLLNGATTGSVTGNHIGGDGSTGTAIDIGSQSTNLYIQGNNTSGWDIPIASASGTSVIEHLGAGGMTFAQLPSSIANGSSIFVTDGTIANPVASGGTGCIAKRLNGVWVGN